MTLTTIRRNIREKGLIIFSEAIKNARDVLVYVTVELDEQYSDSLNYKYNRPKGFYGYAQVIRGDFVVQSVPLDYGQQLIYEFHNEEANSLHQIRKMLLDSHPGVTLNNIIARGTLDDFVAFRLPPFCVGIVQLVYSDYDDDEAATTYGNGDGFTPPGTLPEGYSRATSPPYDGGSDGGYTSGSGSGIPPGETRYFLVGEYLSGSGTFLAQGYEAWNSEGAYIQIPTLQSPYITKTLVGYDPSGTTPVYTYKLLDYYTFNGGWKAGATLGRYPNH